MDSPHPEPTTSPYNFGLGHDFRIALIPPFLYFLIRVLSSAMLKDHPLLLDQPSYTKMMKKAATDIQPTVILLVIFIICCTCRYHNSKRHKLLRAANMDHTDRSLRAFLKHHLFASDPVLPPDEYHVTKRQEAMRLLFLVVISALSCPIIDHLLWDWGAFVKNEWIYKAWIIYSALRVFQIGVVFGMDVPMVLLCIDLQCLFTATATVALAWVTFGGRYGVVDIWDRRIERWVKAFEKERSEVTLEEWKILWEKQILGMSLKAVKDEVDMDERNNELLTWRRGMKEGRGYGPDYWLPRVKGAERPFQYSNNVDGDANHPRDTAPNHVSWCWECKAYVYGHASR
ncbi:uncharacterized protein B0T23DRAFT_381031 [Neurospora hispaniola]|uniref:Uncharacterized protein n=1 Tax=Neurospora hispaniola TaxID=588809 RepID=A0AAJ0I8S7_9PEZI|nr:hypothetical protein B0T23DRAFT_381031 [Neurospora hispaniola]